MKIKKLACIAASVLMAGTVAVSMTACGGDDDGLNADGSVAKITLWAGGSEWSGDNYKNLEKYIKAYNNIKPDGFEVKLKYKTDLETSFQSSLTNGKQPDLMIWDRFNTATNSIKGYLEPMTKYFDENGNIKDNTVDGEDGTATQAEEGEKKSVNIYTDFYAPAMQEMTYEDEIYGLPIDIDIWGVYVNMDWVKDYDAKHPTSTIGGLINENWTWNDLLTVCNALKDLKGQGVYSGGDQFEHLFKYYVSTGKGDEYLKPLANDLTNRKYETNFENDETKAILQFFKDVKAAGVSGNVQEQDSFRSGRLGVINYTLYHNNYIKSAKKPVVKEYKFLPQPKAPATYKGYSINDGKGGVNGGMIGGYGLACPKPKDKFRKKAWEARHEAAWKFMQWMCCDKDNMLSWSKSIGSLPAFNAALKDDKCVEGDQVLADARTYATKTVDGTAYGKIAYTIRPQVPNYLTLQTDVVNQTVRACIDGGNIADCISTLKSSGNQKLLMGL